MANWIDACPAAEVPDGGKLCLTVQQTPLVVAQIEGAFYAIENTCPHAGLPLGEGDLAGRVITCPYHGYAYNITNGKNIDFPQDEPPCKTHPVRVNAGTVQVNLNGEANHE